MVQLDPKRFDLLCRCISIGNIVLFIARFLVKKVLEKKQELETSDSKAKSFSEFLYRYCKMEGDQSYTNSMKAVSGYLQKRMTCKSILQNLWEIEDFERKNGCYRVCLNYCGYITQRCG
ncbi:hypothetical protein GLYMA_07G011650v4 [Glycine max]|nr:hypothetical protein GLYMA_07G011650v4 [Glycine max]KAH1084802.1 hypothetical protein GYH30_017048 [Glycine max]